MSFDFWFFMPQMAEINGQKHSEWLTEWLTDWLTDWANIFNQVMKLAAAQELFPWLCSVGVAAVQRTVKVPRLVVNLQILKKFSRLGQACYTSTTSDQARKFSQMFLSCLKWQAGQTEGLEVTLTMTVSGFSLRVLRWFSKAVKLEVVSGSW